MAGFDAGTTTYSRIGLVEVPESEVQDRSKRFREFIRSFHRQEEFIYREQLRDHQILDVDLEDLGSYDQELMRLIKEEPLTYVPLFEHAARLVLHQMMVPQPESLDDVPQVQLRVTSTAHPTRLRELTGENVARLIEVPGIITSASKTRPKATVITVACRTCKNIRKLTVRPGLSGVQIPRNCDAQRAPEAANPAQKCGLDPYQIVPNRCEYIDHQTLKLQELPEDVPTSEMPRHILLSCDRSLVEQAAPGSRVTIVGIYCIFQSKDRKQTAAVRTPYIRVLGIQVEAGGAGRRQQQFSAAEEAEFRQFAQNGDAYETIAKNIAPSIFGHEDIKKAIALLLVGGSRKKLPDGMQLRGDINVLLLGDPSTAKSQLLKYTEQVAPICVYTSGKGSSAAGLTASVVRDPGTGEFYLEGGAMVLADGGVVCIDEFDKMREEDRVAIHEAMEQQTISIAKAGITTVLNSRTSVLAAANPQFGRYDDLKSAVENIDFQSTILSRFDLIFVIKDVREEERDKTIAKHVLELHVEAAGAQDIAGQQDQRGGPEGMTQQRDGARGAGGAAAGRRGRDKAGGGAGAGGDGGGTLGSGGDIDMAKLKRFIAFLRARMHPRLAPEAAQSLQNHFVKIREDARNRRRDTNEQAIPITIRQLEAIVRLSEAVAKFSMAPQATVHHVDEALRLFKVATLEAAASGVAGETSSADMLANMRKAEVFINNRIHVGTSVPEAKLINEMVRDGHFDEVVTRKALNAMLLRQDIEYRANGRLISRRR